MASPRAHRPSRFARVLVATDFTPGAEHALERVGRLPLTDGGLVDVVHVLPPGAPKNARAEAKARLEAAAGELSARLAGQERADVTVTSVLLSGEPYIELIRRARAAEAELMVLGRHGRRPIRDMFLGSTAARSIRVADVPTLVVAHKATRSYRRPLIAVDLTDTARATIGLALRALGPEATRVTVAHAYHVPFEGFLAASPAEIAELRRQQKQAAAARLKQLVAPLGSEVRWGFAVVRGDPRTAILGEAVRRQTDLLVLGTHARSGIAHMLVGSVAEWLIEAAPADVLVARPARVSFELP